MVQNFGKNHSIEVSLKYRGEQGTPLPSKLWLSCSVRPSMRQALATPPIASPAPRVLAPPALAQRGRRVTVARSNIVDGIADSISDPIIRAAVKVRTPRHPRHMSARTREHEMP